MDLQTLRANVRDRKYEDRQQFLADVHQIFENSKLYNGAKSVYTYTAQTMLDLTLRRFAEVSGNCYYSGEFDNAFMSI